MIGICVEIKTECKSCGSPLPVNALVEKILCPSCQKETDFQFSYWRNSILESAITDYSKLKEGEGQTQTVMTGEYTFNIMYGLQNPRCSKCKTPIDENKYEEFSKSGNAVCSKCGYRISARHLTEDAKKVFPEIKYAIGEDSDMFSTGKSSLKTPEAFKPVLFTCPSCGGNLEIDGSNRMLTCKFCNSQIYLPDDLWFRLHPVKEVLRWYMLFDNSVVSNEFPSWYHIPGFTIDKDGNCYLASSDNNDENFLVWSFGPDLKTRWIRKGLKYDHDKTGICMTNDGNLYLYSGLKHSLLKLSSKDGSTISSIEGKLPTKDDPYSFNLLGCESLVCDSDGSILALINNVIVRFNTEGKRIQLWKSKFLGIFGSGIGKKIPPDDESQSPKVNDIWWSRPKRVDSSSTSMNFNWDGYLYMLDMSTSGDVIKFDKSGKRTKHIYIPLDYRECIPWADRDGNFFIVGKTKDYKNNLIKISPNGKQVVTLLKDIKEGGVLLEEDKIALAPDGTVYLYSYYKNMKAFSPDMKMIYRSKQAEKDDEEARLKVKEALENDEEV